MRRALIGAGALCLAASAAGFVGWTPWAHADTSPPGSGFGSFGLSATAPGEQVWYDFPSATSHPQAEGEVPYAVSQLAAGPQGYGLATVAWPGSLAANGGSTAQVLGLGLPTSVTNNMNDPVRAEARTGTGPPTVTNTTYPGTTMTASATNNEVDAEAFTNGTQGGTPGSSSGKIDTHASTVLTGASTATATAESTITNLNIGGVLKIASVVSDAVGTTNAQTADAHGATTVSGVTVAGFPATIDQSGLHVGSTSAPANATANAIANQALAGAGIKVYVSQPSKQVQGAQVTYTAGSVVILIAPPGNSHGDEWYVSLGGASVTAGASPGFGTAATPTVPVSTPVAGPAASSGPATSGSPDLGGSLPASEPSTPTAVPAGPVTAPRSGAGPAPVNLVTEPAVARLPRGLSPLWPVIAVFGAALCAVGMRRLPDRVLEQTTASCPLGGDR